MMKFLISCCIIATIVLCSEFGTKPAYAQFQSIQIDTQGITNPVARRIRYLAYLVAVDNGYVGNKPSYDVTTKTIYFNNLSDAIAAQITTQSIIDKWNARELQRFNEATAEVVAHNNKVQSIRTKLQADGYVNAEIKLMFPHLVLEPLPE